MLAVLAVLAPPAHGPAPVEGIEVTKPPWPMLWLYPIENWVGVSGILWATLAVFAALLVVPFVEWLFPHEVVLSAEATMRQETDGTEPP